MDKKTHKQFVDEIKIVHPNLTIINEYINSMSDIFIKDELGIVYKVRAGNLIHGHKVSIEMAVDKTEAFRIKLKLKYPDLELIGDFTHSKTKVRVIDKLGILYDTIPYQLLKRGASPEGAVDKNKAFEIKSRLIHKDKYNYSNVKYINNATKVNIICEKHGEFSQRPMAHLSGNGCHKCGRISAIKSIKNRPSWHYSDWISAANSSKEFIGFKVYIIQCWNDEEEFYKIGKTYTNFIKRFGNGNTSKLPYNYKVLKTIEGSALYISNLEKELQMKNKDLKYIPMIKFGGMYECFSSINEIKEDYNESI